MRGLHAVAQPDGVGRSFETATHPQDLTALAPPRGFECHSSARHTAHL